MHTDPELAVRLEGRRTDDGHIRVAERDRDAKGRSTQLRPVAAAS
jgi:hypothetical protein